MAHYKTYRIDVSLVNDDMIPLALEKGTERLKSFGENMPPDVLLDEALNLIRIRDKRKLDTYAVIPEKETYLLFITTVPLTFAEEEALERELGFYLEPGI